MNEFRIIVFRDEVDGSFVAHSVDHYLIGVGETVEVALREIAHNLIRNIIGAHELGLKPFENVSPAPTEIISRWESARQSGKSTPREVDIPSYAIMKRAALEDAAASLIGTFPQKASVLIADAA